MFTVETEVTDFQIIVDRQNVRFYWTDDVTETPKQYHLSVSTDDGATWDLVITTSAQEYSIAVPYDISSRRYLLQIEVVGTVAYGTVGYPVFSFKNVLEGFDNGYWDIDSTSNLHMLLEGIYKESMCRSELEQKETDVDTSIQDVRKARISDVWGTVFDVIVATATEDYRREIWNLFLGFRNTTTYDGIYSISKAFTKIPTRIQPLAELGWILGHASKSVVGSTTITLAEMTEMFGVWYKLHLLRRTPCEVASISATPDRVFSARKMNDDVSLLLHFNGLNNSTSFIDNSNYAHTITTTGNTKISSARKKFGKTSGYFDGVTPLDLLSAPDSNAFNFGNSNFTIDFHCYPTIVPTHDHVIYAQHVDGNNKGILYYTNTGVLRYYLILGGSTLVFIDTAFSIIENQWQHIRLLRYGNLWKLCHDGIVKGSVSAAVTYPDFAADVLIGAQGTASAPYVGYLDELIVVKGRALSTGNFTPPTKPYVDNTLQTAISTTTGAYTNKYIVGATGNNANVAKKVTAYDGATKTFTTTPFPYDMVVGDAFYVSDVNLLQLEDNIKKGASLHFKSAFSYYTDYVSENHEVGFSGTLNNMEEVSSGRLRITDINGTVNDEGKEVQAFYDSSNTFALSNPIYSWQDNPIVCWDGIEWDKKETDFRVYVTYTDTIPTGTWSFDSTNQSVILSGLGEAELKPYVLENSEVVYDTSSVVYTKDIDYSIDYREGSIKRIYGSSIPDSSTVPILVDYTKKWGEVRQNDVLYPDTSANYLRYKVVVNNVKNPRDFEFSGFHVKW